MDGKNVLRVQAEHCAEVTNHCNRTEASSVLSRACSV